MKKLLIIACGSFWQGQRRWPRRDPRTSAYVSTDTRRIGWRCRPRGMGSSMLASATTGPRSPTSCRTPACERGHPGSHPPRAAIRRAAASSSFFAPTSPNGPPAGAPVLPGLPGVRDRQWRARGRRRDRTCWSGNRRGRVRRAAARICAPDPPTSTSIPPTIRAARSERTSAGWAATARATATATDDLLAIAGPPRREERAATRARANNSNESAVPRPGAAGAFSWLTWAPEVT